MIKLELFLHLEETYILVLEHLPNHEYEKSKFIRGKIVDEEDFVFPEKIDEAIFVNEKREFRYFEKFISFSESQEDVLTANPPIILIGSAGSGKTSVVIERLRALNGKTLYTSFSKNLVENSKEICGCSDVEFSTFDELFGIENEIDFEKFKDFASRNRVKEVEKYFEEFRGVITAVSEKSFLSKDEYLDLGIRNSLFLKNEREKVYSIFEKYLKFLETENLIDSNMEKLESQNSYDFIVIDEVQDFTNSQISAILKLGKDFILSGDSNQIIYSNFFSWSKLKTMLFQQEENSQITLLKENYRNSKSITEISNKLLKIKQLRFGSIDRESNYLIETVSKNIGKVSFWIGGNMAEELNKKKQDDVNFAVIVFNENSKVEARKVFKTPLIFTVQEAKGLEYKNIVLYNFVSNENKKFFEIVENIRESDLEKDLQYSRPKDKTDRELDIYKIYINSLYVAFTRGIENLYIFEKKNNRIWEVLNLVEAKKEIFERTSSESSEWEKEAEKLQKFGRNEQIENIQKRQKDRVLVEAKPKESLEDLKREALNPDRFNKKAKDKLFEIAKEENDLKTLTELSNLNHPKAKKYFKGIDKNPTKKISHEQFLTAVGSNKISKVKGYLKKGANVNSIYKETSATALMYASQKGNTKIVELLIENKANLDLKSIEGATALIFASQKGNTEIVELLLNSGANPNLQNKNEGATALIYASKNGQTEMAKLLIENKANLDLQNNDGSTALMIASQNGHSEIVELLIENKANLDLKSIEGATALMYASENGQTEIVKLLIENGANPNLQDKKEGATALMYASENGQTEIVKLLIENGANPNLQDKKEGGTALMFASQNGQTEIVKLLIENGANLDLQKNDGVTALINCSINGHTEMVKLLIENGANLDLQAKGGQTALMIASQKNRHSEIVKLLKQAGAKK
jgi:ankyrin repeat protein/superfamily I DNA/RNA helicase